MSVFSEDPFEQSLEEVRAREFPLPDFLDDLTETASFISDVYTGGAIENVARVFVSSFRAECLSVRLPRIAGGEYLATAADWWAQQAVGALGKPIELIGDANERINSGIQDMLGIPGSDPHPEDSRPRARSGMASGADGFLVKVPGWEDVITINNDKVFDERDKRQRFLDYQEQLARSPVPPSVQEMGELLTTLDDLQDEVATLAVVLMIAEKLAGRAIPGVGWVATAADALNLIYAVSSAGTGSSLPGKRSKRLAADKARSSSGGMAARLDELRRSGSLKVGLADLLQGLQATDSMFGTGIQLGAIMGFGQDLAWGAVRGAEVEFPGPVWDPLAFSEKSKDLCYRSPSLTEIHPQAGFAMSNMALGVWSKAARIAPYLDLFDETVLASTLVGMRMTEQVLGPWLRSGVWVRPLARLVEVRPFVGGGVEAHDTRHLRPDEWLKRTQPAARVALRKALSNVPDRARQAFYDSMVSSIGMGLIGDIEPNAKVVEQHMVGPIRDAALLLEAGHIPRFDLGD